MYSLCTKPSNSVCIMCITHSVIITVKSFWNGAFVLDVKVSDTEVENMNNSKNKLSTAGIQLTYVTKGSLVLWTKISKELFVDKEVFLSSLNVFFGNIFENSRLEAQPKTQVDIQLEIPDEDFDGKPKT